MQYQRKYIRLFNQVCLFLVVFLQSGINSHAQKDTTHVETAFKNTVRFNITNPILFGSGSIIFGYERVLKNNQSFSINIGTASYRAFSYHSLDSAIILHESDYRDQGFHISGDYRFYLKKENKYPVPRGLYLGPYFSYNYLSRTNTWGLNSGTYQGEVYPKLTMNIFTVGAQLGYQIIFWKRLSVDIIIFGPGIGFYSLQTKLSSSLSKADEEAFFDALNKALAENIPGYNRVIGEDNIKTSGTFKTTSLGYRYVIFVGFRF